MKNSIAIWLIMCFTGSLLAQNPLNQLDEKGAKHGLWKGYHPESKRLRYEGTFKHGQEVGVFKFYDDTQAGTVIATREFNPVDHSVYTTFFDQKNNKVSEGKAINRLNEGVWNYYHFESKALMTVENYKKGKLDGKRTIYYRDGKPAEESFYVNGLKAGTYKKWADNGVVLEEAVYENGEYNGKFSKSVNFVLMFFEYTDSFILPRYPPFLTTKSYRKRSIQSQQQKLKQKI